MSEPQARGSLIPTPRQVARDAELASLIADQEQDILYGDTIRYSREVSLDAPLGDDNAESLNDVVGAADADLAAMLGENETWVALVSQKQVTDEDVRFWRYLRMRQGWTNTKIAEHVGVSALTVGSYLRKPPRRGSPQSVALAAKLPVARSAYEAGARLIDVAEQLYLQAGYGSAESCYQALRRLFLDRRVAIRPQSWKHGMRSLTADPETSRLYWRAHNRRVRDRRRALLGRCQATTREKKPCSRWAREGTNLCNVHAGLSGGPTVWTPEAILGALNTWKAAHGHYPRPRDWMHAAVEHPNFKTVYGQFPSWPWAVGCASRAAHRENTAGRVTGLGITLRAAASPGEETP